jgi:hypothetical protein
VSCGSVVVKALCYKPEGRGSGPDEVNEFISILKLVDCILLRDMFRSCDHLQAEIKDGHKTETCSGY